MAGANDFPQAVESKVTEQLRAKRVGYLLGSGSSYLNGTGYPLAVELWDLIKDRITDAQKRTEIQSKLDGGANGIEHALDLLDDGGAKDTPYRHLVTSAIADLFLSMSPSLDLHSEFVRRLSRRTDPCIKMFSLNYDPLVERAAETAQVRLVDGFLGHEHAFFRPAVFSEVFLKSHGPRAKPTLCPAGAPLHLYKLHGSVGWYDCPQRGLRRCGFQQPLPANATRLMVPPQRRKASEVVKSPYSPLWTAFRGAMAHDPKPLDRLVCLGYGFADEHVNDIIESATARHDFTLLILTKALEDGPWNRWHVKNNVIIVTETRCSQRGQVGPGHPDLWKFDRLSKEV